MMGRPDDLDAFFETNRRQLFGLAYRMLGSASEAEDVVQEAFLRWSRADRPAIRNPDAWLRTVTVNLCLDQLESARARRERYVGLWLPEPVRTDEDPLGPLETVEQREQVSLGLLTVLERLTPQERAVFVLREAFAYPFRDIASALGLSETGCRQLLHRARLHMGDPRPRFHPTAQEGERLMEAFVRASREGDVRGVERLLAEDVAFRSDGGDRMPAARRPVHGANRVARLVVGLAAHYRELEVARAELNGGPGLLLWAGATLLAALVLELQDGEIAGLYLAANPDKLAFLTGQVSGSGDVRGPHQLR
jgi:RNA polymerase sigma factor (sigma-70 family)